MTKMVQCPILNNSHAYPFCKTTPGTQLFSIGHCTIFCQWNLLKTVTKLLSQWKSGCTTQNTITWCSVLKIDPGHELLGSILVLTIGPFVLFSKRVNRGSEKWSINLFAVVLLTFSLLRPSKSLKGLIHTRKLFTIFTKNVGQKKRVCKEEFLLMINTDDVTKG